MSWLLLAEQAVALHHQGDLDAAERLYAQILLQEPSDADIWNLAGVCAWQQDNFDRALQRLQTAIQLQPEHTHFYNNLGNIWQGLSQPEQAIKAYQQAIALDADYAQAWTNLGVVQLQHDQPTRALQSHRKALAIDPNHLDARFNLGYGLAHVEDWAGAEPHLLLAHQHSPQDIDTLYYLSLVLLRQNKPPSGLYEHLLQAAESPAEWWIRQALHCENLASYDAAEKYYRRALDYAPENATARYLLAILTKQPLESAPTAYVSELFDAYAPQFDHTLRNLQYQTPAKLQQLVDGMRFGRTLDLGCGTGIMGSHLRSQTTYLAGVDISEGMLQQAKALSMYDALHHTDIVAFLETTPPTSRYDLVVAADVWCYFGSLLPVFTHVHRRLKPDGCFLFSIESTASESWEVSSRGRYQHPPQLIEQWAQTSGFAICKQQSMQLRQDSGSWIMGWGYVLKTVAH